VPPVDGVFDWDQLASMLDFFRRNQRSSKLSIAVVGSSGNLLYRRYGADIDSKDVVLRFNDATTVGHEADVGQGYPFRTRGLVRVGWSQGLQHARDADLISPDEHLVVTCANRVGCDGWYNWAIGENPAYYVRGWWSAEHLTEDLLHDHWGTASTGFVGLAIAVAIAQRLDAHPVDVYGFGPCHGCGKYFSCDEEDSSDPDGGEEEDGENGWHAFEYEADVRRAWHCQGVINLHDETEGCGVCGRWPAHQSCQPPAGPPPSLPPLHAPPVCVPDLPPLAPAPLLLPQPAGPSSLPLRSSPMPPVDLLPPPPLSQLTSLLNSTMHDVSRVRNEQMAAGPIALLTLLITAFSALALLSRVFPPSACRCAKRCSKDQHGQPSKVQRRAAHDTEMQVVLDESHQTCEVDAGPTVSGSHKPTRKGARAKVFRVRWGSATGGGLARPRRAPRSGSGTRWSVLVPQLALERSFSCTQHTAGLPSPT